ncbi:CCR4-NOT transcription complex subunit 4-like isoform X2 [Scleropages formosus]|uniref:CCR4-NOT transcription complex subunit 4-like isoform X2 n=1 Tax=Scleropages formosus TaxID=113540 RepID=UPI00087907AB|nr:CCR4-NOT transcription complex subunit 4-like isoform X2 [Scleropages formosus]
MIPTEAGRKSKWNLQARRSEFFCHTLVLCPMCHRMSRSPEVKDDTMECPLCMEPLEIDDINFFPCTCGYQICRFCWHRIRTDENGLCPACRKPYPEDPAIYKPLSPEDLQRIKNEKKQKQNERKQKMTENRKHLASVRVVQRNLVFVVGLSQRLADTEVLKRPEYFGKFGKIHKVVINNSTSYAGSQGPSASAYVTYLRSEDALRAVQCVNNVVVDGRTLKASLGTTKYCSYFLKSMQCPKPDCMYLHELGDEAASFTKEEMQAGKHQEYEQKLLQELYKLNPAFLQNSTGGAEKSKSKSSSTQRPNSSNKEAWPWLQGSGKAVNGLADHHKTPPLLDGSDSEHLTPDGPDSDLGPGQGGVLSSFPSNCDPSSPSDKIQEAISIGNGENIPENSRESPSPPPGLTKSGLVVPISVSSLGARSPFEGAAAESQSLFSDNSNFRHPNPVPGSHVPFHSSSHGNSDWPTAPEPQSLFTSDWQAAFGFGSSKQQDDDLGFDPFDVTRKALADLIEKELSVQDASPLSPNKPRGPRHGPPSKGLGPLPQHFAHLQHRAVHSSFSFPSQQAHHPWLGFPAQSSLLHLNHMAKATSDSHFMDLSLPAQRSPGVGGFPITESSSSVESIDVKEWQDGLRALLPNINISFGGLPNSSSSSSSSCINHTGTAPGSAGLSHGLNWDRTASWTDPAIITGIPATSAYSLDSLRDENPPHWLKSLQALTEMEAPGSTGPVCVTHSNPFSSQLPLHRAGWAPAPAGQFHSPPPGFQTAFRPPGQTATELLQSATMDRH